MGDPSGAHPHVDDVRRYGRGLRTQARFGRRAGRGQAVREGPPSCPDRGPLPANAWRSIFGVTSSRLGRALDIKATAKGVVAALGARLEGSSTDKAVKVKTMQVAPKLSTEQAKKKAPLVLLMGSWSTYYTPSAHNGFAANISIPARRLDGYVVQPGALFDFWARSAKSASGPATALAERSWVVTRSRARPWRVGSVRPRRRSSTPPREPVSRS